MRLTMLGLGLLATASAAFAIQDHAVPTAGQVTTASRAGMPVVKRFTVPGDGSVNSYWIDAPSGLIVVDFQRDLDSARLALAEVKKAKRPVAALLLTHAHPDHIGGLDLFKTAHPKAPIYASQLTADELKNDTTGFQKLARQILGDRAPARHPAPDRIVRSGERLKIAGLDVTALELGPGEATSATVFHLPAHRAALTGDLAGQGMTDFLLEGRSGAWLTQLGQLQQAYPGGTLLLSGHGAPADLATLVAHQKRYLTFVRTAAAAQIKQGHVQAGKLTPAARRAVADAVKAEFGDTPPVAPIPDLLGENADAVAGELLRERTR